MLAQARVRAARAGGIELVLANPSGGRGSYVLRPEGIGEVARLTVHDRLLVERLTKVAPLTPATVRAAAREVAATGAAGREAAHAAVEANARDAAQRVTGNLVLIVTLLRRSGLAEVDWRGLDLADRGTQATINGLLARIAPALGLSVEALLLSIDEIAGAASGVGFLSRPFDSRCVLMLEAVERFAGEARDWARLEPEDRRPGVELIAACAAETTARARACLDRLWACLDAVPQLARRWSTDRPAIEAELALPDWLLDGWPYICAVWDQAASEDRSAQRTALARIETLVPALPADPAPGTDRGGAQHERLRQRRWLRPRDDFRSPAGAAMAIGRNEMLRAVLP
jgi:hypothetical protein